MRAVTRAAFLRSLLIGGAYALASACGSSESKVKYTEAENAEVTFYLVRHAEKELTGDDPDLSPAGLQRAQALAERLKEVKLTGVYSTDTVRTRGTAANVLAQQKLDLTLYDGRALDLFAQEMLTKEGHYLIVGHSNTTPQLAEALGGEGGDPIVEASEYDRLYIVKRTGDVIITELQRY